MPLESGHIGAVIDLLRRLQAAKIFYRLSHNREDALTVEVAVPGERWEIDFLEDGTVDVERFISSGRIEDGESAIKDLFAEFSD